MKGKKTEISGKTHQNGGFGSGVGFVLACVGSAVGMGNIWMFPYRVGQYGGGAFLVPYILFVALFGLVGLSAEFAIGRRAGTGTLGAYEYCWNKRKKGKLGYVLGWIPLMGSLGIAIGYSVIVGWVLRSLGGSLTGALLTEDAATYFSQATGDFGSVPWHLIIVAVSALILMFGATKGIEKINKILMPAFFILFAILAVRVAFLPGASEGYKFLFIPDWSKDEDIPKASVRTAIFDTIAAMLAALAIMPAVFAFGIEPNSGPPLMFITLPNIFKQMPMGQLFAVLFFVSVVFAGVTSLINMFEAVSESWQTRFKLPRKAAVALCAGIAFVVGLFLEAEPKVGSWMDFITIIVVPFGAVLGAVSIYYILGYDEIKEELEEGRSKPLGKYFKPLAKYVYVPMSVIVFVLGILYGGIG